MGWANCGEDSKGRPIGYAYAGTCDEPDCERPIYRGLDAACGGMHGDDEWSCEGYFCGHHLVFAGLEYPSGPRGPVCARCRELLPDEEDE